MDTSPADFEPGERVVVYSFGVRTGVYAGPGDHPGWIRVTLDQPMLGMPPHLQHFHGRCDLVQKETDR